MEESIEARVERLELPFDKFGVDPYGISKPHVVFGLKILCALYRRYFRVRAHGIANVPVRGRCMLVGNHSGGVAMDGAMVIASMFLELEPPRLAQGMAEKFINRLPWASLLASRTGQFTGSPEIAERLLLDERMLMIFPEGARGTAKLYRERHSLVEFGTGFMRLALKTRAPIIPFGFLGGGEAIPTIANSYTLGKLLGLPYLPITPYGAFLPLPVPMDVYFGAPMTFHGTGREDDHVVHGYVEQVKDAVRVLIERGRMDRPGPLAGVLR